MSVVQKVVAPKKRPAQQRPSHIVAAACPHGFQVPANVVTDPAQPAHRSIGNRRLGQDGRSPASRRTCRLPRPAAAPAAAEFLVRNPAPHSLRRKFDRPYRINSNHAPAPAPRRIKRGKLLRARPSQPRSSKSRKPGSGHRIFSDESCRYHRRIINDESIIKKSPPTG